MTQRMRVLAVDDDEGIRSLVATALGEDGYDVATAPDGVAALSLLAMHWRPELILLDVAMPRMDGPAFAGAYASGPGPYAPIILLTASSGVDAAAWAERTGASGFLRKPFDLNALEAVVRRHAPAHAMLIPSTEEE
jgi:two-component system, chemotaxis family, chemotaxis protein CheY